MESDNTIDKLFSFISPKLLLKELLDFGPIGVIIFDNVSNQIIYANKKMERLFGATHKQILNSDPFTFLPDIQPNGLRSQDIALSNYKRVQSGEKISFIWQQRKLNGELFFTSITSYLLENTNKKYSIALHHDITSEVKSSNQTKSIYEKYKLILDNAFDGIILFDGEKNRPVDCNQRFLDYLGISKEKLMDSKIRDISAPIQINGLTYAEERQTCLDKIKNKGHHRYEWIHVSENGKLLYAEVSTVKLSAPHSHLRLSIVKDKTKEQETFNQLNQTQKYLLEAQSAANLASFQYNVNKDELVWSNYAYEALNIDPKLAPKEISFFVKYVHEEDQNEFVKKMFWAKNNHKSIKAELRIINPENETVHALFRAAPQQVGQELIFLGSIQDITAIKSAEINFRDSAEKYKDLFDNMHDAFLIVNKDGTFGTTNLAAQRLLGYTKEELKTIRIPDIVHPEDAAKSKKYLEKLMKDGYYVNYTGRIIRKDGSIRYLQVNSSAIKEYYSTERSGI